MPKPHVNVRRSRVVTARSASDGVGERSVRAAQHPPVRQLRQQPVHRLLQPEQAVLGQAQHHRRGDRLGDRGDPEQRVRPHRRPSDRHHPRSSHVPLVAPAHRRDHPRRVPPGHGRLDDLLQPLPVCHLLSLRSSGDIERILHDRRPGPRRQPDRRGCRRVLHEPGHVGDALRRRAGFGARDARGAGAVRGRRHRRRRRVRADRRQARRRAPAPRAGPGQRPGQPAQRPPRPDPGRRHRGRARHRPRPLRRAPAVRHRGTGPNGLRLGAYQRHLPRPGPGRHARRRRGPVRPDRHPGPPRRRLLERRRIHRPAPHPRPCPHPAPPLARLPAPPPPPPPPSSTDGRLWSTALASRHALPRRDGPVRARPAGSQPDQRRDRRAAAGRDVPGAPGARRRAAGRRPAGLPGRDGRGPAGRRRSAHPGRRPLAGVVLRLPGPGQRPGATRLLGHRPGRTRPGHRGRPRNARGPGRAPTPSRSWSRPRRHRRPIRAR